MLKDGRRSLLELRRKCREETLFRMKLMTFRIYMEWNNNGAGSDTSARKYETAATGPVTKDTLWGSDWKTWVDTSY